jgi:hypothetical protein
MLYCSLVARISGGSIDCLMDNNCIFPTSVCVNKNLVSFKLFQVKKISCWCVGMAYALEMFFFFKIMLSMFCIKIE